jgi:hypothetical protein
MKANPRFAITFDPTKEKGLRPHIAAKRLQCDPANIYKLANSGHLRSFRPTPKVLLVSEADVTKHAQAQIEDPDFWEKPENRDRFVQANFKPSSKARKGKISSRQSTAGSAG